MTSGSPHFPQPLQGTLTAGVRLVLWCWSSAGSRQSTQQGMGSCLLHCLYVPVVTETSGVFVSEAEQHWQAGELEIHLVTYRNCGTYFLHRLLVTVWGQRPVLYGLSTILWGDLKPPHRQKFCFRNGFGKLAVKYQNGTSKQVVDYSEKTVKGMRHQQFLAVLSAFFVPGDWVHLHLLVSGLIPLVTQET